jgi:hypothetical protein
MSLISLNIRWDVARAFVTEAALMVSPRDGNGNYDVGGRFRHFGLFSSLTALMIKSI